MLHVVFPLGLINVLKTMLRAVKILFKV